MEQAAMLNNIQVLAQPIAEYHVMIMKKLDSLTAAIQASEGYLRASIAFQTISTDAIGKLVREELQRTVVPAVERSLNSHKSSHHAELQEIRQNLDQIISGPRQSSVAEDVNTLEKPPLQTITDHDRADLEGGEFLMDYENPSGVDPGGFNSRTVTGAWSRSSWIFRYKIGFLVVHWSVTLIFLYCGEHTKLPVNPGFDPKGTLFTYQ